MLYNYIMVFKDRWEAGIKLAEVIKEKYNPRKQDWIVLSLLRGGVVLGKAIEEISGILHLPLPVAKVSSPYNPEYAIGALCFNKVFIHDRSFSREQIRESIKKAREKFESYLKRFSLNEEVYDVVENKNVIIVDDGVATGSSAEAGALFVKDKGAKKIIIAVPVAPEDYIPQKFDDEIILHKAPFFSAVSQFYEDFSEITDEMVKKMIAK